MIKILFLIHDLGYGGAEKVLVNLANNLNKTKYDVTVKTLFDVGENRKFLNKDVHYIGGLKNVFRGNATLMKFIPAKLLSRFVVKGNYDIVVAFLEGPVSRIVSAYSGKKVAWIHTDFENIKQAASHYWSYNEMCKCYNSYNRVICVSKTVKNKLELLVDLTVPCEVLYNVNDTDAIIELAKSQQNVIVKMDSVINIVSVGRLIPLKRFDVLINIHKKLLSQNIRNNLFIFGEGSEHQKLQKMIDDNNLNDSCKLLGFNENPYKYISNADLFICSSNREGFSTAVTEALVVGTPVVSTDVSGAKELLGENNEYGIVTEVNEDALYDGVYTMLTEKGLLEHYKGQAEIRGKTFNKEKTTKAVEEMLENL